MGAIGSQFGGGGGGEGLFGLVFLLLFLWLAFAGYTGLARGTHRFFVDIVLGNRSWSRYADEYLGQIFRSLLALGLVGTILYFVSL